MRADVVARPSAFLWLAPGTGRKVLRRSQSATGDPCKRAPRARYLKTFPEGGFWKGQNYLFDRRFSQKPELKSDEAIDKDTVDLAKAPDGAWKPPKAHCSICKKPYAQSARRAVHAPRAGRVP